MKGAFKGKEDTLVKRASAGKSKEGEHKELLRYLLALEKLEPPVGEAGELGKKDIGAFRCDDCRRRRQRWRA